MAQQTRHDEKQNNDKDIPQLGLGTWKLHKKKINSTIKTAIKLGYNHIDTAKLYRNERAVGNAIQDCIKNQLINRDELFITSKLWNTDHNPKYVISALKKQLQSMSLKYLDLYLIHSPIAFFHDIHKPYNLFPKYNTRNGRGSIKYPIDQFTIEDTWKCMEKAVQIGLVKNIGLSNFNIKQIKRILKICKIRPLCVQCECHPYLTQTELIQFCHKESIQFVAYSPFGSLDYIVKRQIDIKKVSPMFDERVIKIAKECSMKYERVITTAQILLKFHHERGCSVLAKATSEEHLRQNGDIIDWNLNKEQMKILLSLNKNWRVITMAQNSKHDEYPF